MSQEFERLSCDHCASSGVLSLGAVREGEWAG